MESLNCSLNSYSNFAVFQLTESFGLNKLDSFWGKSATFALQLIHINSLANQVICCNVYTQINTISMSSEFLHTESIVVCHSEQ